MRKVDVKITKYERIEFRIVITLSIIIIIFLGVITYIFFSNNIY